MMDNVSILPYECVGQKFIPDEFLPAGKDEHYLRNEQSPSRPWRTLRTDERDELLRGGSTAEDWNRVFVSEPFDPRCIARTAFYGLVRIGPVEQKTLAHGDLRVPCGITDSTIISSDIGSDAAIHHVRYLSHYIIGDRCLLMNIDEMQTTNHAAFGQGILKQGMPEHDRPWIDVMNENGARHIAPFNGILPADAYLWAKYREDEALQKRLLVLTDATADNRRGLYGLVGTQCVLKNVRLVKDVNFGTHVCVNGAGRLQNLTVNSSETEPTRIGSEVELVNGIIGYGCSASFGAKAINIVLGNNAHLRLGARVVHSVVGDNSTIACCEVLNTLLFPAHEQHHNNSFLIASVVMGQSNIAAGATIGSNHNSRANDNELLTGRGFWPGLCTSIKYSSRFASFVLLAKGDFPAELDIPFPFSLVNNNASLDRLEIVPAFWWHSNMYALARNTWKFQHRDKRERKDQKIEFSILAPDTIEETFHARHLLELWTAKASVHRYGTAIDMTSEEKQCLVGKEILSAPGHPSAEWEILGERLEKSKRPAIILKAAAAYDTYGDMILLYSVKNILDFIDAHPADSFTAICDKLQGARETSWINLGGQLVRESDIDKLRAEIVSGVLASWEQVHARYAELWQQYPAAKQRHAYASLCALLGTERITDEQWNAALDRAASIQQYVYDRVVASRKKDYDNPFIRNTFRNNEELAAVLGTVHDNPFIKHVQAETEKFKKRIEEIKRRSTAARRPS